MCECVFFIVCVGVWNGTPEPRLVCVCGRSTFQNFRLRFFNQWVSCDISGLAVPVPVPKWVGFDIRGGVCHSRWTGEGDGPEPQ